MNAAYRERKQKRPGVWDKYELIGEIGQGTYGVVFKARLRDGPRNKEYAIKTFKTTPETDGGLSQSSCREIMLCRELQHTNIVELVEVLLDHANEPKTISMIFGFAEYDLLQILEHHRSRKDEDEKRLPDVMIKSIMWQILNGVAYLHANWVLHRDLKPANVLIMGDGPERGVVKIADLGLARLFQSPLQSLVQADRVVVTIWYRSPELLLGAQHYTKAIDIWSIGCILAELWTGQSLFKGREVKATPNNRTPFQRSQLEKIFEYLGKPNERCTTLLSLPESGKLSEFIDSKYAGSESRLQAHFFKRAGPGYTSNSFVSTGFALLKRLLEYEPGKRITAEEALNHEFFKEAPHFTINAFQDGNTVRTYPKRTVNEESETSKNERAAAETRRKKLKLH